MLRKYSAVITAALLLFSILLLVGCGVKETPAQQEAAVPEESAPVNTVSAVSGTGTEEDPWKVGAENPEDVLVFVVEDSLFVNGNGKMMDFENPEGRPWHGMIAQISGVNIFDALEYVGKNAFCGAGTETDWFDVYLSEDVQCFGESCFEGAAFPDGGLLTVPAAATEIGPRAFAGTALGSIYFSSRPEIASDAFAGVTADLFVQSGCDWGEQSDFGGSLNYRTTYAFHVKNVYDTDDCSGEGCYYVEDGELFSYNAADNADDEGYRFARIEAEYGLDITDETDPLIEVTMDRDISVTVYYEAE